MPIRSTVFAVMATIAMAGCGSGSGTGSGGGSGTNPPPQVTTYSASSGVAQKGPLILGSTVTAQELSATLAPTGKQYSYQTDSDLGTFNPNSTFTSRYIGITATGYYFDEVTNAVSTGPISLQGYADLAASPVLNVNLLTTLAYRRVQTLVSSGQTFAAAQGQAEREVLAALGIPSGTSVAPFVTLDISKSGEGDKILAAISGLFSYGNNAANLAALIASVQNDIGTNGRITAPTAIATLNASARALDPTIVAANLNQRYNASGTTLTPADISDWVDHDGDGVVRKFEFRVADASQSSVFTLPSSFVTQHINASVVLSAGRLLVNGAPVAGAAEIHAGDVIAVTPPQGNFQDGVSTLYVVSGSTRLARITFVHGLQSIAVTPVGASQPAGITQQLQAMGTFTDGSTQDMTNRVYWSSSSTAVASVSSSTGLVTALTAGSTMISATFGLISSSTTFNVTAPLLQSISLSLNSVYLAPGVTRQLTATGHYSNGTTGNLTSTATWSSGDTALATVTGGLVSGVALGATRVAATHAGITASATVNVMTEFWSPVASLGQSRTIHSGSLLANGRVLIVGGYGGGPLVLVPTTTAFLYDPVSDTWTSAPSTQHAFMSHTATVLADGRVLIAGGGNGGEANAEIYDPIANSWTTIASMALARVGHSATLLADGRVLVVGGYGNNTARSQAEIYDPVTNVWSSAGNMAIARSSHAAILLNTGKVLVAGSSVGGVSSAAAELYDPATNAWSPAASMAGPRGAMSATKLPDGRILVAGGGNTTTQRLATAEIYDPATDSWSWAASMNNGRERHRAVTLLDGRVMVVAGNHWQPPMTVEIYDPVADAWLAAPDLLEYHSSPTATVLPSGAVLVVGGSTAAAEIYQ